MRGCPPERVAARLAGVLADGWGLRAVWLEYVPEGGGSYHWAVTDAAGERWFVTVNDLGSRDWLGGGGDAVFDGLGRALSTAAALRYEAGLKFVIAPIAACVGQPLRRVDAAHSASVFPFLPGRSHPLGPYTDEPVRGQVLDMIAALHQANPRGARPRARPCPVLRRTGRA
jgi:spectinomycin phosphotransferase